MPTVFPVRSRRGSDLPAFLRHSRPLQILLCTCLIPAGALAQTVFLNFDTPGQYTGNFNAWNDNGGTDGGNPSFAENASDGAAGSGGVSVFQNNDTTATYKTRSWDFSTNGATITVSVLLKANGLSSGNKIQLGLMNVIDNGLNNNAGVAFESFRFVPNSATSWSLREQYRTAEALTENTLGNVTVTAGNWYKFVVTAANTSGATGNYSANCALFDFGADGLTPGGNVISFSTVVNNPGQDIAKATAVWPAFRAFQNAGVDAWDNFVVFTPASAPVITGPMTNTVVAAGNPATFSVIADGPGAISYAWFTNGVSVSGASGSTYSTPPLNGSYTNVMVVASNSNGSATNQVAITVIVPNLALLTNLPATGIRADSATLHGQVLDTGGDAPDVTLYYGPQDGGTNAGNWANNLSLGQQTGAFALSVSPLSSNTTYYFNSKAVNSAGTSWASPSASFTTLATNPVARLAAVLTYHNDNTRMGVNSNETILNLSNVNTNTFGRVFSYPVDGFIYAQPLVMTNVNIPGKGVHNVVYVATEHNSIYAFDADDNSGANAAPLWHTSFINPAAGVTTVPNGDVGTTDITPEIGITSTPVIDPVTATIYVEVKTKENGSYVHRLHALDIATGLERTNFNSPGLIECNNYPGKGNGDNDGQNPPHVLWNPLREHCRPALTLLNGVVYMSFASHGDNGPYHGWMFGYNATNVAQQVGAFNATPNGGLGGFWDGGGGPSVDAQGNLYFQTGNGTFDGDSSITTNNDYSMSLLKLSTTNGIKLVDYFAPSNAVALSSADQDLGSAAPIILPDSAGSAAHPHLVVGGGKTSPIYLVDRDNMGRFNGTTGTNRIVQQFNGGPGGDRDITPAFFNNTLYIIDAQSRIGAYKITNALFNTTPVETPDTYNNKGEATACISSDGTSNAIAWAIYNTGGQSPATPAVLRAYNATNLTQELYASDQLGARDAAGDAVKFTIPTIANGKVYVGAQYSLTVYGLGVFLDTPLIAPNGGTFTNSVTVSISDDAPGTTIYYTLDGSTPTTNSTLYTGPFVLTTSANVQAIAVRPGTVNSGVVSASFLDSSAIGQGTGLLGSYWSNTSSSQFTTPGFNTPATLVRTDSVVNFDWGNGSPDPSISSDTFVARWTGAVQPQFNETYTFYTTTDDGVRLWVNGQLIIDEWVDQGPTEWSGTIALNAQQRYNIRMEYYENGGGATAMLSWSCPSSGKAIIPQSQLYPETNPPPAVILTAPTNSASYTAVASVTMSADAAAQYNDLSKVDFYANGLLVGTAHDLPYVVTATGLSAGNYVLTAVATDGSGLSTTSAPVNVTVKAGSGQAYGLTTRIPAAAFLNMPETFDGALPTLLSQTGVFTNMPALETSSAMIPYNVNVPLWSDGAVKRRWFMVPNTGAPYTPDQQISFAPTGEWSFPAGTIFVKDFELVTNEVTGAQRRLETRLLVRDALGAVYGVTYKWRPDNSDADLLTTSLSEDIAITGPEGVRMQTWYYPSPADCLQCHTPAAHYVLGPKTRQLDGNFTYPSTGVTDNELRTLNRLGLFNPGIDEAAIPSYPKLVAITNLSASLEDRSRSYIDANCAQCHRPSGPGPTFDARYDTALTNQNIINAYVSKGDLGYDNARVVVPKDIWRSILYQRTASLDPLVKMPWLARNVVDTNALSVLAAWINSLPGTPALAPPTITPAGGTFGNPISVSLQSTNIGAQLYYTLNGLLPTTNSFLYSAVLTVTNTVTIRAIAVESGFNNSVATKAQFTFQPPAVQISSAFFTNEMFQIEGSATASHSYVLEASTNLVDWIPITTNAPTSNVFELVDPDTGNFLHRFYRVRQQ